MAKIAVVTGANKGIGYAAAKGLAKVTDGTVYLTARNVSLGEAALKEMKKELGSPHQEKLRFHRLDLDDSESVTKLRHFLLKEHGGLDILINNAGIAYKSDSTAPFGEQAEVTNRTNYYGTKLVCQGLFPILRPHSRVVNVSSRGGCLGRGYSSDLKNKLKSPSLTEKELDAIVDNFIKAAKKGTHQAEGYPNSAYGLSKCAEVALSRLQKEQLLQHSSPGILVNCCCPGYVSTDMSSHKGPLTPDQGAETLIFLATLPAGPTAPNGLFFAERKPIDWETGRSVQ